MFLGVLVLGIGSGIQPIISFFITLWKTFTNKYWGLQWSFIGIFFLYLGLMCGFIPFIQYLQFIFNSLITPVLMEPSIIAQIMHCNINFLSLLFGLLTVGSAIATLNNVTSSVMMITYVILIIYTIFFSNK